MQNEGYIKFCQNPKTRQKKLKARHILISRTMPQHENINSTNISYYAI